MAALLPVLEVSGPNGERFRVELAKDRLTIGRFRAYNDVGLEPDPQQLVTRRAHCVIERDTDSWWIIDNGSVNRTFLWRDESMEVVNGRAALEDGDAVRILGMLTEDGAPIYWDLVFHDPLKTNPVSQDRSAV